MDQIEILRKAPKEHYTLHNNKLIRVEDLLKLLTKKENKKKK
jgi:hypothetical protein